MMNLIILIINLIVIFLGVSAFWLAYQKDESESRHAKKKFGKRIFYLFVIIALLNGTIYVINYLNPKEEPSTKQDFSQLRADLFDLLSNTSEPSQKEVNSELDVNNELDENKKRALEEYHKGLVAYRDDNYKIAIVYFEKALNVSSIPSFYTYRGISYLMTNQIDKAIADFDNVIHEKPKFTDAYNNRAVAWILKGHFDKAIHDCYMAIQLNPSNDTAYNTLGVAWYQKGKNDKAIENFDKVIQINHNSDEAYYNRATILTKKGNYDNALTDFDKAIKLNPNFVKAYYDRGYAYSKLRHNKEAAKDLNYYLKIGGNKQPNAELVREEIKRLGYNPEY